jgi:hypothetical protein
VIKNIIASVVLLCAFSLCQADEPQIGIAKVDFRELEALLQEVAFAKPENHEIRDKYLASKERERAMLSGELDFEEAARGFGLDRMDISNTVETLVLGELIFLIEDIFGDRYQLVVSDSYGRGIIYTEIAIPDITPNIRQRLLQDRTASQTQPQETQGQDTPAD